MSGKLFLIVGPSGVGKGALVRELRTRHPEFFFPTSATTRAIRKNEKEGEQYHFISNEEFAKLESRGEFLETAAVHQFERYGILKQPILEAIKNSQIVIREVDIQGLQSILQNLRKELFSSIFISPPDFETLEKRILRRQPEISRKELAQRLKSARREIAQKDLADFEVISQEGAISKMVAEIEKIIIQK